MILLVAGGSGLVASTIVKAVREKPGLRLFLVFSQQLEVPWHSPTVAKALEDSASVRMVPGVSGELLVPESESARRRNQRNHRSIAHLLQSQDRTLRKNLRLRQSQLMGRGLPRRHQNTALKPETAPSH